MQTLQFAKLGGTLPKNICSLGRSALHFRAKETYHCLAQDMYWKSTPLLFISMSRSLHWGQHTLNMGNMPFDSLLRPVWLGFGIWCKARSCCCSRPTFVPKSMTFAVFCPDTPSFIRGWQKIIWHHVRVNFWHKISFALRMKLIVPAVCTTFDCAISTANL